MVEKDLHKLISLLSAEIVTLSEKLETANGDSGHWYNKYAEESAENTRLKERILMLEGEQGNVQSLLERK